MNLQMFKLDSGKAEPKICCQHLLDQWKSKSSRKTSTSAYWLCQSLWLCGSQQTVENSSRDGNARPPASWEICTQAKQQQLEDDMEQQTGSKSGKEHIKAEYCQPAYLTSMQSTFWEMPGWMNHKLESRLLGETATTSDKQRIPLEWQKAKRD